LPAAEPQLTQILRTPRAGTVGGIVLAVVMDRLAQIWTLMGRRSADQQRGASALWPAES
jgi:hypothetical protein